MALLYADECFPLAVVEELRRLGHDVLTVQEAGQAGAGDPAVLAYAVGQDRAVLTHNRRHFLRLHRQSSAHRGIVICTRDDDSPALANRIHQAIQNAGPLDNQLLRVYRPTKP